MRFRPCIDLCKGVVVQIVGNTLSDTSDDLQTNFASERPASYFAQRYRDDGLDGGHVIMLGPGNESAAESALATFPEGLQVGGGVDPDNGPSWIQRGAAGVIVTSYLFEDAILKFSRAERIATAVDAKHLIVDLSCAEIDGRYFVAANRWQTITDFEINRPNLERLSQFCSEFLIHATQVEGKQAGIDTELLRLLADISPIPTTYAGGIANMQDIDLVAHLGEERLDFTVGSALDLFGGSGVKYENLVQNYRTT